MRGAATVGVDEERLEILKGDTLTLYQWNTRVAEHYFCKVCGIYTHHRRRSNPREFGVNVGALKDVVTRDLEPFGWTEGRNHPSDAP